MRVWLCNYTFCIRFECNYLCKLYCHHRCNLQMFYSCFWTFFFESYIVVISQTVYMLARRLFLKVLSWWFIFFNHHTVLLMNISFIFFDIFLFSDFLWFFFSISARMKAFLNMSCHASFYYTVIFKSSLFIFSFKCIPLDTSFLFCTPVSLVNEISMSFRLPDDIKYVHVLYVKLGSCFFIVPIVCVFRIARYC